MALTAEQTKILISAVTDTTIGNTIANAVNSAEAVVAQSALVIPAAIVATAVSQTTDFAALRVGDKVLMIPATAGNADLITIGTAGTLGQAAVIGNIYVVLRAYSAPTTLAVTL